MSTQKEKSPQVLKELPGGIKITSNEIISQSEIISMLCDGDGATKDREIGILREFITIGDLKKGDNHEANFA